MSIDSTWLRCPNCFSDLAPVGDRTFGCTNGHRFDRSKYGFLTLLPPKAPRTVGDDRSMLDARAALLGSGAYQPISDALARLAQASAGSSDAAPRIADLGCGTGHYSAELARVIPNARFLLADRSPDAVRASLRALPGETGVVLDIWRPLPLRSSTADLVLNVFAPRNGAEFARILRPGGRLLVIVPTERHLRELRVAGLMLDVPPGKSGRLVEQLAVDGFTASDVHSLEYDLGVDAAGRRLLAGMGPAAHHSGAEVAAAVESDAAPANVTVSVELLEFQRSASAA
ncbi:methyltransferase domain-containing protein [Agromyces sp. NPDC127015]|uniref:methyltransferase domain-containing protein n=1 Tax=Agromyces sp. NPDC127015 TaxID=3347108 RepID=UPI0036569EB1